MFYLDCNNIFVTNSKRASKTPSGQPANSASGLFTRIKTLKLSQVDDKTGLDNAFCTLRAWLPIICHKSRLLCFSLATPVSTPIRDRSTKDCMEPCSRLFSSSVYQ